MFQLLVLEFFEQISHQSFKLWIVTDAFNRKIEATSIPVGSLHENVSHKKRYGKATLIILDAFRICRVIYTPLSFLLMINVHIITRTWFQR